MIIQTFIYDSWNSFLRDYKKDLFSSDDFIKGTCLFRGQQESEWSLSSSFDRKYGRYEWKHRKKIHEDLLCAFSNNCKRSIQNSDVERLSIGELSNIAQHYGIPTRLLDWSYSPFIAAYFAFTNIQNDSNVKGDVAIWVLFRNHEIWNSNIGVNIEEEIVKENDRQKRQLGCFTILNHPANSIEQFVQTCNEGGIDTERALCKICIPKAERRTVILDLDSMNINASTIFGGYEGCARAARDEIDLKLITK